MSGLETGKLNRRIAIERAGIVKNDSGDMVDGFAPLRTVWASATPGGGRERLLSAQNAAEAPMVFRIRWAPDLADLSPADRVQYPPTSERYYDIASVVEIGTCEGIEIAATARA